MSERQKITLTIRGGVREFFVAPEKEIWFRNAEKKINDLAERVVKANPNKSRDDVWAYVCVYFAEQLLEAEQKMQGNEITSDIEKICEEIDEFIKINQ